MNIAVKKTWKRRMLSVLAAASICMGMLTIATQTAHAAGIQGGTADLTVASSESGDNTSVVAFSGYEWYVIGCGGSGVNSTENSVTLFLKNDIFPATAFRTGVMQTMYGGRYAAEEGPSYNEVLANIDAYQKFGGYALYAKNTDGSEFQVPDQYFGSTLQSKMSDVYDTFISREQDLVISRDLSDVDGPPALAQKVWPLHESEYSLINNTAVLAFDSWYWLRNPSSQGSGTGDCLAVVQQAGTLYLWNAYGFTVPASGPSHLIIHTRPAFTLDVAEVLLTSATSSTSDTAGKGAASVGGGFVSTEVPSSSDELKYTFKTDSQTVTIDSVSKNADGKLGLAYSGATTGTNQYVSCIIKDSSGNVKYYDKLTDCADSSAASGEASIALPDGVTISDLVNGTYSLYVFSEQANGALYSDFASELHKVDLNTDTKDTEATTGGDGTNASDETKAKSVNKTAVKTKTAETGDDMNVGLYLILMAATGLLATGAAVRRHEKQKETDHQHHYHMPSSSHSCILDSGVK